MTTLAEWRAECAAARARRLHTPDEARLVVTTLRDREPRGERVRLAPGLFGRLVGTRPEGKRVRVIADVLVRDVEAWIAREAANS